MMTLPNTPDIFHVHWRLTNVCNYACPYCQEPEPEENCVYMRERLVTMAQKIISEPWPQYDIVLGGGEPALHPFLEDLSHLLLKSGRKVSLTVETNASQDAVCYERLAANIPDNSLRIDAAIHPRFISPAQLIALIAVVINNKQSIHFRLFNDSEAVEQTRLVLGIFNKFSHLPNFTWEWLEFAPDGQTGDTLSEPLSSSDIDQVVFEDEAERPEKSESRKEGSLAADSEVAQTGPYCCQGVNYLRIEPDGHFYGAPCAMTTSPLPLWHEKAAINSTRRVFHCACQECRQQLPGHCIGFASAELASGYMDKVAEEKLRFKYQSEFLPPFNGLKPTVLELVRARLKRLRPGAGEKKNIKIQAQPDALWKNLQRIVAAWAYLANDDSRFLLLQAMRAIESGSPAYLPDEEEAADGECQADSSGFFVLRREEPVSLKWLKSAAGILRQQLPGLELVLPWNADEILSIMAWLREEIPGYNAGLRFNGKDLIFSARHPDQDAPITRPVIEESEERPEISIIMVCGNDQDVIGATLDSILAQECGSLEIIAVEYRCSDASADIIAARQKERPEAIRIPRMEKTDKNPFAKAINHACGRAIMFLNPGDMLCAGFLSSALKILSDSNADIAAFDYIISKNGQLAPVRLMPGEWQGEEALGHFLAAWAAGYSFSACLCKTDALLQNAAGVKLDSPYWQLEFACKTILPAAMLVPVSDIAVLRACPQKMAKAHSSFLAMLDIQDFLNNFAADNNLSAISTQKNACLQRIYTLERDNALREIRQNGEKLLSSENLLRFGRDAMFITLLLSDYAEGFCKDKKLEPEIAVEDMDWQAAASAPGAEKIYKPYGNADAGKYESPKISVIMPNFNKAPYLAPSIESVLSQSMRDFELIIVDDRSTDGSWRILQDFADFNPEIRLYRMDNNVRQGICRNVAIEKARGEFLVFLDSDDIMAPGMLDYAYNEITAANADIAVFGWQIVKNGKVTHSEMPRGNPLSIGDGLRQYVDTTINATVWGKIFRRQMVVAGNCRFEEYVYHQDNHFLARALAHARKIIKRDFCSVAIVFSEDSTTRPKTRKYLHIRSALCMHDFLWRIRQKGVESEGYAKHMRWHFEEMFLPTIYAFKKHAGCIPLTESDLRGVMSNELFLRTLLQKSSQARLAPIDGAGGSSEPEAQIYAPPPRIGIISFASGPEEAEQETPKDQPIETLLGIQRVCLSEILRSGGDPWRNGAIPGDLIVMTQGKDTLAIPDLLRAAALMTSQPDIDALAFIEPALKGEWLTMDPGAYTSLQILELQSSSTYSPLMPSSCVFRKSFLETLRPAFDAYPLLDMEIMLTALALANRIELILPDKGIKRPYDFSEVEYADFERLANAASDAWALAGKEEECGGYLVKLMELIDARSLLEKEAARGEGGFSISGAAKALQEPLCQYLAKAYGLDMEQISASEIDAMLAGQAE